MTTFSGCELFDKIDDDIAAVNTDNSNVDTSSSNNSNDNNDDDSNDEPSPTTTKTFQDSITSGISYTFDGGSGTSASDGKITYTTGKTVTLKLGSLLLGTFSTTKQSAFIYPQDSLDLYLCNTILCMLPNLCIIILYLLLFIIYIMLYIPCVVLC